MAVTVNSIMTPTSNNKSFERQNPPLEYQEQPQPHHREQQNRTPPPERQQQQQQAYQGTREQENNPESFADAFFKWHQRLDQIGPNSNLGDTFLDETHIDRDGQ